MNCKHDKFIEGQLGPECKSCGLLKTTIETMAPNSTVSAVSVFPPEGEGWDKEFDSLWPNLMSFNPSPSGTKNQVIKGFIQDQVATAKQEGRDALLKELGMTHAWNYRDIKAIEEKARARAFEEAIKVVKNIKPANLTEERGLSKALCELEFLKAETEPKP